MPTPPSRESQLTSAFAAFADQSSVSSSRPLSLREATSAFQGLGSVYDQHLRVFDVHPLPFDPSQIRLQHPDFQTELLIARDNLQGFTHAIEAGQDVAAIGNGYQTAQAIVDVIRSPFYRNMSELPLEQMAILIDVFHRIRLQLAVALLESVSDNALSLLNKAIPGLEQTLRMLPKDRALNMLATTDYSITIKLGQIDRRMRGNRSDRRTQYMPAPKFNS